MSFGYIYIYIQLNSASTTIDHPLDGTQLVVLAGLGGRVTLAFRKVPCIIAIISTFLSLIESYLTLTYLLSCSLSLLYYKVTQRKKSMSAEYKFQKSLQQRFPKWVQRNPRVQI